MADLLLVGTGLVSPLGLGVPEHVLYARASVFVPAPAAFEKTRCADSDDGRLEVLHCGFLGAQAPLAERLSRLAEIATHQALAPWEAAGGTGGVALALIVPLPRPGADASAVNQVRDRLSQRSRATAVRGFNGAASAFAAWTQAAAWLDTPEIAAVLLVAVDTHVAIDLLVDFFERQDSPFARRTPPPSEGAAACLLTTQARAKALGLAGPTFVSAATAAGQGNDDDDAILDGRALTTLVAASPGQRIHLVSGQELVDDLRSRDWFLAHARAASRFSENAILVTPEEETGRLGAAAGVAALAFGAGQLAHGVYPDLPPASDATLLAWAISPDGTRGVGLVRGGPTANLKATHLTPKPSVLDPKSREPLTALSRPAKEGDGAEETAESSAADDSAPPALPDLQRLISGAISAANDASADVPEGRIPVHDGAPEPLRGPLPHAPAQDKAVRLRKGKGAPVSLGVTYSEVAAACLDGIALAARHRRTLRWDRRAHEEERLLAFADALWITPRFVTWMNAWWQEAADLPDPWKAWAPVFVIGCLRGDDVADGLTRALGGIPEDDADAAVIAGEALATAPLADRGPWLSALARDSHPPARAAALRALSLRGELAVETLLDSLAPSTHRTVALAAANAASNGFLLDFNVNERLAAAVDTAADPDWLWAVLRALALRGRATGIEMLRRDTGLLARLGSRALDVLAFFGDASDAAIAKTVVARSGLTSRVLLGLGRYGHPGAAPLLLRALSDEDHAEDAANALVWLFGEPFDENDLESADAWKTWLRTTRFPEDTRLRFGEPYSPSCVAEAVQAGARSEADIGWMLDEAHVRCGLSCPPDLATWSSVSDAALAPLIPVLARESAAFSADPWRSVTRGRRAGT